MDTARNRETEPGERSCGKQLSLRMALGWLSLGMVGTFPIFAAWKFSVHGLPGLTAAGIAFLLCFGCAAVAIVVTHQSLAAGQAGTGLLLSMLVRTGVPLLGGMMLAKSVVSLESVGILGLVMLYYLVALLLETAISVLMINRHHGAEA